MIKVLHLRTLYGLFQATQYHTGINLCYEIEVNNNNINNINILR